MPDPLTTASAFATIVGLICNYRQEKGANEALDYQKFIEWLDYHKHEEIINLICNTAALQGEVDNLLRADHAVIIEKLEAVNTTLASLMSQVTEFRGLALTMMPAAELSDQAVQILQQLANSKASFFVEMKYAGGCVLSLELGGQIQISEPRFLNDDLEKLICLGLLSLDFGSSGGRIYRITRNAVRLIETIGKTST